MDSYDFLATHWNDAKYSEDHNFSMENTEFLGQDTNTNNKMHRINR